MKANYKKYNIGGMLQSTSSPMISQGMQGSLSSWGGSPTAVFNEGGKTEKTMDAMLGKKINALVGKSIMLFGEGQSMPTTQKITEVRLSPPSFRYRDLFFKVKGSDFEETIPQHDIVRFLLGEQVDVYNPAKGEYYAWQLSTRKKMKNGGKAEVKIENKDVKFDKKLYKGVLDDFDLDGLPNADDPNPLESGDGASVEQTKLSTAVNNVIRVKDKMDVELDEFIRKLQKTAPNDSKIYGRTKTPYSILNKLVSTRLLDQKRGLQDLVGTTVAFNNFDDLVKFKKRVEKGMFGKVVEFKDYYENPNDGYRAYHFIVEQNGTPIELQLKTDRMKQVNVLSHDAYKNKDLDVDYLLYLTTIANEADKGNAASKAEFERVMSDRVAVKKKLSSGKTQ
jgi:ppGpp synthetase/RelA/SpoT-type nucleotidyltranferase